MRTPIDAPGDRPDEGAGVSRTRTAFDVSGRPRFSAARIASATAD
jgi:hypothetical protein